MDEIYKLTIAHLRKSFDILWQAVQDRKYNSRSILGDELLDMKDAFDELDRDLTPAAPDGEDNAVYCSGCGFTHKPGKCPDGLNGRR